MADVTLRHVYKVYDGGVRAVNDFDLEIKDKEFVVFVGPSGCGKSTTLRMIAGLEEITAGQLYIDGQLMNEVEPKNRDIAMVFQSYALYPHMTVYDNMAFGLKLRHTPKEEIDKRVRAAAEILEISELLSRKPKALSGGQRQRVALGRAIVRTPKVFLLDEPLSNLDAKLRVQMRTEITKLHEKLHATFIYVTHDQTEAMTMANRIVVMKDGYVQQIGKPREIYKKPVNKFVASFIGSPAMNFLNVKYLPSETAIVFSNGEKMVFGNEFEKRRIAHYETILKDLEKDLETANNEEVNSPNKGLFKKKKYQKLLELKEEKINKIQENIDLVKSILNGREHDLTFGIRPESISINKNDENSYKGEISLSELLGDEYYVHFNFSGTEMLVKIISDDEINIGDTINVSFDKSKIYLFDTVLERTI
jgi:multiple sugar transport system ATP-binding protein